MTSRSNRRCAALVALLFACLSVGAFAQDAKKSTTKPSASAQKAHDQILKAYGVYGDQALQDYVAEVGQRVARQSSMPDAEFKFVVLDDDSINAFTTGCCYVYVHRGLLTHLNSEAELASVLGHEIAHVTQKHPQKQMTRGVLATLAAAAAAIYTGSGAVGDLANLGAQAWMQGYGRDAELEADRVGLQFSTRAGYRPEAMGEVFTMFKQGERFEIDRARRRTRAAHLSRPVLLASGAGCARRAGGQGCGEARRGPPERLDRRP